MSYFADTRNLVSALWDVARFENPQTSSHTSIFDVQERWMLMHTPALYVLEKASNISQAAVRKKTPDKIIFDLYERLRNNKALQLPAIADSRTPSFRLIKFNQDFNHNGQVQNHESIRDQDRYETRIEALRKKLRKDITPSVTHFILLLSLNFGGEDGGHFGAVIGTPDGIFIFDPYYLYYDAFRIIVNDAFTRAPAIPFGNVTTASFLDFSVEVAVHPQFDDPNSVNLGSDIANEIQSLDGQDHFCWAWCILYFHYYMLSNCSLDKTREFFKLMFTRQEKRLYLIKAYVYYLFADGLLSPGNIFKKFFMNVFNHVWDNGKLYRLNISFESSKKLTDKYLKKQKTTEFSEDEFDSPVMEMARKRKADDDEYQSPALDIVEIFNNMNIQEVSAGDILLLKTSTATIQLTNEPITKNAVVALIQNPPVPVSANDNNIIYIACVYYGIITSPPALILDPDAPRYTVNNTQDLVEYPCDSPERKEQEAFYLSSYDSDIRDKCEAYKDKVQQRNDEKNGVMAMSPQTCDSTNIEVFSYQSRVVEVLANKVRATAAGSRIPGLLVWYGTGTGKTIAAGIAAKYLVYCNALGDIFDMCYIIAPKSAYSNFAKDLKAESIFFDKVNPGKKQKEPDEDPEDGDESDIYYRAGKIKIFTHSNFKTYNRNTPIDFSRSLLIVDEAHNFIDSEGKPGAPNSRFMLETCSKMKQVVLLTATPIRNEPYDIMFLLSMLDGTLPAEVMPKTDFYNAYIPNYNTVKRQLNINFNAICNTNGNMAPPAFNLDITVNDDFRRLFSDKIIRYEQQLDPNADETRRMPPVADAVICNYINNEISADTFRQFQLAVRTPGEIPREENARSNSNSFGAFENNLIWNTPPRFKLKQVGNIIMDRERTAENLPSSSQIKNYTFDPKSIKYKYIIFSAELKHLKLVEAYLTKVLHINRNIIDTIDGSTKNRAEVAARFNRGDTRIMLITQAAEEGVDFKRVSTIILLSPVYSWAEYLQIRGRGVRTGSHAFKYGELRKVSEPDKIVRPATQSELELSNNGERQILINSEQYYVKVNGKVADTVECIVSVVHYTVEVPDPTESNPDRTRTSTSFELAKFSAMYKKRFILEDFERQLTPYFVSNPGGGVPAIFPFN